MNNVFPESLDELPEDPKEAIKVMEKYIRYMTERMDFALSGGLKGGVRNIAQLSQEVETIEGNIVTINGDITDIEGDITTINGNITNLSNSKVDKEAGKGLSEADYTTTEKTKLAGIETGANKTIVDGALSASSTNPVQNKVVQSNISSLTTSYNNLNTALTNKVKTQSVQKDYSYSGNNAWKNTGLTFTVPTGYWGIVRCYSSANLTGLGINTKNDDATLGASWVQESTLKSFVCVIGTAGTYYVKIKKSSNGSVTVYANAIYIKP